MITLARFFAQIRPAERLTLRFEAVINSVLGSLAEPEHAI
jgi:hypothetical protein